ncbi:MAG: hypothetical protein RBR32_06350, partial [Bacteroidales bacterium]|nr:hypothetical protein [Bacteroidales bacterium]
MRKIFFTLSFLVLFSLSFSQDLIRAKQNVNFEQSDELQKLELSEACSGNSTENSENQSPFEAVKGKKEDLSKRDAFSKHYINEDGSYTALIGAGPIHYDNNGNWEDINHRIVETNDSDYKYANTTNVFESYFGTYLQNGIISKTQEAKLIEFLNPKMYWEVNGQAVQLQTADNVAVSVNEDKAIYKNIFGEISAEYTILTGKRELNYIIPSLQALGNIPNQAEYLVFVEDIELPQNWTASMEERGISIKNQFGENVYLYENPHSTDAENIELREENTIYEIHENGNIITVKTKVKANWILSQERIFPVKVDPTVNALADAGRSVYSDGEDEEAGYFGLVSDYWLQYYIKFNTSAIPNGSTINSATGHVNFLYGTGKNPSTRNWQFANSADPTSSSGVPLYNSANLGYSDIVQVVGLGWRSSNLYNPEGNIYIQNSINN